AFRGGLMTTNPVSRGADGYYHPNDVTEVQWLVRYAAGAIDGTRRSLRVRGSAHSVPAAIYSDGYDGEGQPSSADVEVMLDRLRRITITPEADPSHALVRVEA